MTDENYPDGKCRVCRMPRTEEGHDPCIANLPGVFAACCGHGIYTEDGCATGYIAFTSGSSVYFDPYMVLNRDKGKTDLDYRLELRYLAEG